MSRDELRAERGYVMVGEAFRCVLLGILRRHFHRCRPGFHPYDLPELYFYEEQASLLLADCYRIRRLSGYFYPLRDMAKSEHRLALSLESVVVLHPGGGCRFSNRSYQKRSLLFRGVPYDIVPVQYSMHRTGPSPIGFVLGRES